MDTDQIIIDKFIDTHPEEAVRIIEKLNYPEIAGFLIQSSSSLAAKVISVMNSYKASKSLEFLDVNFAVEILEKIDYLTLELLLRQCDPVFRKKLLEKMPSELSAKIRHKLKYPSSSVGSLMNMKVFSLPGNISVKEAEQLIRSENDLTSSVIFVTGRQGRLEGVINLHDLISAGEGVKISSILNKEIPSFFADDPIETLKNQKVWIGYKTIPVINRSGILVGSLQYEDMKKKNISIGKEFNKEIIETGNALGELYRIGLTGLLQSTGNIE